MRLPVEAGIYFRELTTLCKQSSNVLPQSETTKLSVIVDRQESHMTSWNFRLINYIRLVVDENILPMLNRGQSSFNAILR